MTSGGIVFLLSRIAFLGESSFIGTMNKKLPFIFNLVYWGTQLYLSAFSTNTLQKRKRAAAVAARRWEAAQAAGQAAV